MDEREAIERLTDHFRIHYDDRPTPYLDKAVAIAMNALQRRLNMIVEKLVNKTKEHYEFAMEMCDAYSIANVIKGYQTFTNLYGLDMITTKTFDKYFNNLYTMANNVYNQYIHDNEEMNKNVKTILSIPFVE